MADSLYHSPAYRRSRSAYRLFCMLEYFIALLVSDVYLFKLLNSAGLGDGSIGILSSLVTAACLFQLCSIGLIPKIRTVKTWAVTFCLCSQTVFVLLYLLPFLPFGVPAKTALAFAGILLGYFFYYSFTTILFQWANSFVEPHQRAVYSAEKEMMSLLGGMIFTFLLGIMMDHFELRSRLPAAFLLVMAVGLIINAASLAALLRIDGDWQRPSGQMPPMRESLQALAKNRGFIRVVVLSILWSCAQYFTIGFLGSYKNKELMLSVGTVQLLNILGNLFRFFLSRPLGRFADRTSYARCIELALGIAAAGFLAAAFASPGMRWFIAVFTLLLAVSQAGIAQNLLNIVYDYVPAEYFVQASSIRSCVSGVCGFGASLVGSGVLSAIQSQGNRLWGFPLYGQQALSAISFVLTVLAAFYVHLSLRKHGQNKEEGQRAILSPKQGS